MADEQPNQQQDKEAILKLIADYRTKTTDDARGDALVEIVEAVHGKYGTVPPQKIDEAVRALFDTKKNSDDCVRLGFYLEKLEKDEEAIAFYNEAYKKDKNYKGPFCLGYIYAKNNNHKEALENFLLCKKSNISKLGHRIRAFFNYGFLLHLTGNYKEAKKVFKDLTNLFEEIKVEDRDAKFWLDYGDHYLFNLLEPNKAIEKFENGLPDEQMNESPAKKITDRDKIYLMVGLVKACNKYVVSIPPSEKHKIIKHIRKAKHYFNTARKLIEESSTPYKQQMAELLYYNDKLDEATERFRELAENDMTVIGEEKGDAYHFLGLCHQKSEKFEEAITSFNESIKINHSIYTHVYLAECYIKLKQFKESEDRLDHVLHEVPYNTNALICQSLLYKEWAESIKTTDAEKAIDYLDRSIDIMIALLRNHEDEGYQRKLTDKEIANLKYSISICLIEKYNLVKHKTSRISILRKAKTYLRQLCDQKNKHNNTYYFKSTRTLNDLERILDDYGRSVLSKKAPLIWSGVIAALIALFMIFFGKPVVQTGYLLDTDMLSAQLKIPATSLEPVFRQKRFSSREEMQHYVTLMYAEQSKGKNITILPKNKYSEWSFEKVDTGIIVLILSVSVAFLLLGLLSSELKSLKVGVIHIEKGESATLMDQIELKMSL